MKLMIKNKNGEKLSGVFHKANDKKEITIVCHGFPGNKDEILIKRFCEKLEEAGINSFRFDFSGFGESEGGTISTTKRISDLKSVINYFSKEDFDIGLIGHSRGATISILLTSENQSIKFLIPIAGESDTKKFLKRIYPEQRDKILKGKMFYYIGINGRKYPITPDTIDDLESYNILEAIKKIQCPILFLHGEKDLTINPNESKELYNGASDPKEIRLYEDADHSFTNPQYLEDMINDCIKWIKSLK